MDDVASGPWTIVPDQVGTDNRFGNCQMNFFVENAVWPVHAGGLLRKRVRLPDHISRSKRILSRLGH